MKFIHLSDLHFHRHNDNNVEALKVLENIKQKYKDHHLIITGDIVDDGHEKQFKRAFEALEEFTGRVFICPGNHDFGAAGNFYSRERAERFDKYLSIRLEQGGTFTGDATPVVNVLEENDQQVMLIALDTNLETEHPFDFACGKVGKKQRKALNTILSDPTTTNMVKILFFHHHPYMHGNPFMELQDGRKLMRTIYNRVDVVLFGHRHVMDMWQDVNGIQYILASDNSPGKKYAREITIVQDVITVDDIEIE